MNQKQKTVILPIISVVALGAGAIAGLSKAETDSLELGLTAVVGGVFTLYGIWGVWKSHDKKK